MHQNRAAIPVHLLKTRSWIMPRRGNPAPCYKKIGTAGQAASIGHGDSVPCKRRTDACLRVKRINRTGVRLWIG